MENFDLEAAAQEREDDRAAASGGMATAPTTTHLKARPEVWTERPTSTILSRHVRRVGLCGVAAARQRLAEAVSYEDDHCVPVENSSEQTVLGVVSNN